MSSLTFRKLSYWGAVLGILVSILTLPPMAWNQIDNFVYSESQGQKLEYKVDGNYDNINGRLLFLEKENAKTQAISDQKSKDDATYREKVQDSLVQILQTLSEMRGRADAQSSHVNRNDP